MSADDTTAPDPRPASMRRRVDFDATPETTTAPVTAEGLRERVIEALYQHAVTVARPTPFPPAESEERWLATVRENSEARADAVLAALAGDPGDLPARMADAIRDANGTPEALAWWQQHPQLIPAHVYAAAALSVRSEDHAATVAELAQALRSAEHAEGELASRRGHERRWELEHERAERLEAELAETREKPSDAVVKADAHFTTYLETVAQRDALKAAIAEVRRLQEMTIAASCRVQAIEQAEDTLAVLDRALAVPEGHEATPARPRHIGGRANAEDCPACTGDLPYPWICPGEPETPGDTE